MKIVPSHLKSKKYDAVFEDGKVVPFGQAGAPDYTKTGDKDRRDAYRSRHAKDLKTNDPQKPGYLSYYLLWNKPTLAGSLRDYKSRFGNK
jgi:hypothetical protein